MPCAGETGTQKWQQVKWPEATSSFIHLLLLIAMNTGTQGSWILQQAIPTVTPPNFPWPVGMFDIPKLQEDSELWEETSGNETVPTGTTWKAEGKKTPRGTKDGNLVSVALPFPSSVSVGVAASGNPELSLLLLMLDWLLVKLQSPSILFKMQLSTLHVSLRTR